MTKITQSVPAFLKEIEQTLPFDNPNSGSPLLKELQSSVVPTLNIGPSPLAAEVIRHEVGFNQVTLAGAETFFEFLVNRTPIGFVHRYWGISCQQSNAGDRGMLVDIDYQNGASGFDLAVAQHNCFSNVLTNLLSNEGDATLGPFSHVGTPLDVYPGGQLRIQNLIAMAAPDNIQVTFFRTLLNGPFVAEPEIVSALTTMTKS